MSLEKIKPIINKFYLGSFLKSKSLKKIEFVHEPLAKPIELSGYEGIDLWILKEIKPDGSYWRISESYTGFRVYYSFEPESKSEAIQNVLADMNCKKITKKKLINLISSNIPKWGLSPRFE